VVELDHARAGVVERSREILVPQIQGLVYMLIGIDNRMVPAHLDILLSRVFVITVSVMAS
jgi:hypothetical protein